MKNVPEFKTPEAQAAYLALEAEILKMSEAKEIAHRALRRARQTFALAKLELKLLLVDSACLLRKGVIV